jgi:hypothetical protein
MSLEYRDRAYSSTRGERTLELEGVRVKSFDPRYVFR